MDLDGDTMSETGVEEKEELATTEEKPSRFRILRETRLSWPKLATWIIIILLISAMFTVVLKPKYPQPAPDTGFKFAYKFRYGYVFVFGYDVEKGMMYVDRFDYVYSDLDLYFLVKASGNYTVTLLFMKKVNKTDYVLIDNISKEISLEFFEFKKLHIDMPKLDEMLLTILLVNGEEITKFYYRFNILYQEVRTSIGNLLMSQVVYLIIGFIVILAGMFVSKAISKVYPTPEPDLKMAGYFFTSTGILLFLATKELVLVYGLTNAMIIYVPFFIISILAGFYIVGERSKKFLFIRVSFDTTTCDTNIVRARKIGIRYYKTPSFYEFLVYKPIAITWDRFDLILKDEGIHDYVIYYDDIRYNKDGIDIKISDIHKLRVEEYKSNIKAMEKLSRLYEDLSKKANKFIKLYEILSMKRARRELISFLIELDKVLHEDEQDEKKVL